jgi:hypothetical protein
MVPFALPVFIAVMFINDYWLLNYHRTHHPHHNENAANHDMKAGKQD